MLLREICSTRMTSYKEMVCNSYTVISKKASALYTSLCAMGTMKIWTHIQIFFTCIQCTQPVFHDLSENV